MGTGKRVGQEICTVDWVNMCCTNKRKAKFSATHSIATIEVLSNLIIQTIAKPFLNDSCGMLKLP